MTNWKPDGTVAAQYPWHVEDEVFLLTGRPTGPPWRWGATDETTPSAPWIAAGQDADTWWRENHGD